MCVNLSKLNLQEHYPYTTLQDAVTDIQESTAKYFTMFNALNGYLDEESKKLTPFIAPFGCYMYLKAPCGLSSITEHYNR